MTPGVCQRFDPRDIDFGKKIPAEIVREGWEDVLRFLRKLYCEGAESNNVVKLDIIGTGRVSGQARPRS